MFTASFLIGLSVGLALGWAIKGEDIIRKNEKSKAK
jgi:cytochrome bd-type quinol oxidase subunit 2